MSKIKVMSENLANKIAAGEVVEKCASVVKELVENSIDAGATNIVVDLVNGGLKEIKVTDDGSGMEHEDAIISFSRHATSKLIREDDLFFINTLGFRGEALPSIASVSEVDLITCSSDVGTHIHIKGGKLEVDEPSNARKGTIITVSNLFYNTPARLKYLKSEQYELSQSVSYIEKLSFSYPEIKFTLTNNGKTLVKTSGSNNLLKTIHEIYGLSVSSNMMEVKASNDDYDIEGYICKPEVLKSNRNHMITIANGRVVKNNDLNRAINDAYFRYKPDIKFPIVVLKFYTDPTLIDVNIHPTKQDIKLSKVNELYELIVKTIGDKLQKELLIPNALKEEKIEIELPKAMVKEEPKKEKDEEGEQVELNLFTDNTVKEKTTPFKSIANRVLNPEMKLLDLQVIGQVLGTYIVCQNDEGMYLIDQHAAKERVNYEIVEDSFKSKEITVTDCLIPITIELNSSDFLLIKEHIDVLEDMGFKLEEFGINTFKINSHPTWLKEGYEEEVIRNIFDEIIMLGKDFDRVRFNNKVIATIACKMSVRANTRLSQEAMEEIISELVKCRNPYNCAHGRPAIVKFSNYELERMFKRVMN
ncbi:MAG: DNA mismatch repair endonuclease MutL [Bacilli bacterium]|nr:DNA mismatch repair endonuclease MutL [Bacilli bacterium]